MAITHAFVNLTPDEPNASIVQPSDWNAPHEGTAMPSLHNVLDSACHSDVLTGSITRGDLLYGNATPKIDRLTKGVTGAIVTCDATDVLWSGYYLAGTAGQTYTFPTVSGTMALGAGTLTVSTANDVTLAAHTHAITTSSNPGVAASILASNASGYLQIVRLGLGIAPLYPLHQNLPFAISDAQTIVALLSGGADVTHGTLNMVLGIYPSATGGNRYVYIQPNDNTTNRNLVLCPNGGGVGIGGNPVSTLDVFIPGATLEADSNVFRVVSGNPATTGVAAIFGAHPSATGGLKFGYFYCGDNGAFRNTYFSHLGGNVGIGAAQAATKLHVTLNDATTDSVTNVTTIAHNSTGTPADGFGAGLLFALESSTTSNMSAARIYCQWAAGGGATHASRKADLVLSAYDTAAREGMRIRGAGSAVAIGFFGVPPTAQPAHIVDADGSLPDVTAKFNTLLAHLESLGLQATV